MDPRCTNRSVTPQAEAIFVTVPNPGVPVAGSAALRTIGETIRRGRDMARRSRDWNEGLAQDLRDPEFAREFLLAAMDEGLPVQTALGKVIRAMGVKEFGERAGMAGPNVLRAIHPRHNPTQATLNRLLKRFQLRLSLARLEGP